MAVENRLRTITEFVGAISIVLSLTFVGLELRHANNLAEAEAVQSINEMFAEKLNTDKSEWVVALKSQAAGEEEMEVFLHTEREQWMNILESAWKSFDRGILDRVQLAAYLNAGCRAIFQEIDSETHRFWGERTWNEYKLDFNPGYVAELEHHCFDEDVGPND
jgi:hypothetical protein